VTRPDLGFPTVGVVGGGQLARMLQQPATALGIGLRVLADSFEDSAAQVIRDVVVGDYRDEATLEKFASTCDVVTFDHEHVPIEHLRRLEQSGQIVHPGSAALVHAQDKGVMRERLQRLAVPTPLWRRVRDVDDVLQFAQQSGSWPVVLKATRGGYDGKGVWLVHSAEQAAEVLAHDQVPGFLVEQHVEFTRELSSIVARSPSGQAVAYPLVETVQEDGVCRQVYAPAPHSTPTQAGSAQSIALRLAGELDVVGLLAVELFETSDGLLVNERAMRPHNSGHWSIDGSVTSQFENHLRAVLDLPLGDPSATAEHAVMVNVLGGDLDDIYPAYLHCMARDPDLKIHMYGKAVKPGRKIGHVTVVGTAFSQLRERALHAAAYLRGDIDE